MAGGGLSMKSIDALAEVLDLHLEAGKPRQLSAKRKTGKKR